MIMLHVLYSTGTNQDVVGSKLDANRLRGRFDVIATTDIKAGEEVIVDYGKGYWTTLEKYFQGRLPTKPASAHSRDERALKRQKTMHYSGETTDNETTSNSESSDKLRGNKSKNSASMKQQNTSIRGDKVKDDMSIINCPLHLRRSSRKRGVSN